MFLDEPIGGWNIEADHLSSQVEKLLDERQALRHQLEDERARVVELGSTLTDLIDGFVRIPFMLGPDEFDTTWRVYSGYVQEFRRACLDARKVLIKNANDPPSSTYGVEGKMTRDEACLFYGIID